MRGEEVISVYWLGEMAYSAAYELQRRLHQERVRNEIEDTLLLLEHPPTFTIGKSGSVDNLLVSQDILQKDGIPLHFIDRGGDITYHGPGQLVGYPILDLRGRGRDIHRYVHDVERVMLRTLQDYSIIASRDEDHPGVWVEREEIGAIGLRVHRWVTMHGFSLNVSPDMEYFSYINPCGFSDRRATSMVELLGEEVSVGEVAGKLVDHFAAVFDSFVVFDTALSAGG